MARCFLAIDLPEHLQAQITRIQPPKARGVNPTAADQLHLTLHFLGEVDPGDVMLTISSLQATRFTLRLTEPGYFKTRDGGKIFWLGLEESPELLQLHQRLGSALREQGFRLEKRKFHPHITVVRLKSFAAGSLLHDFQQRTSDTLPMEFSVTEIILYASQLTSEGPLHEKLLTVALTGH